MKEPKKFYIYKDDTSNNILDFGNFNNQENVSEVLTLDRNFSKSLVEILNPAPRLKHQIIALAEDAVLNQNTKILINFLEKF